MILAPRYLAWATKHYGQVPFDLASSGIEAVSLEELDGHGDRLRLDAPDGPRKLREAIAAFNGVPFEEVIPALGTTHALWLLYSSLVRPGDEVLVESPSYEPIWMLAEVAGATLVRFDRSAPPSFAIDVDAVLRAVTERTRVVAISNPNNPTGQKTGPATLKLLAERLAARKVLLLVDEVYAPLGSMAPGSSLWGESSRRLAPNIVAVSSLTKSFGLSTGRIGWILGPPALIASAENVILATCGSFPLAHANQGARAFAYIGPLSRRAHDLTAGKRETVEAWISRRGDLTWSRPESGLFGFAVSKGPRNLLPVIEEGAQKEGVLVAAGEFFGVPNGFRLSWSIARDKLQVALGLLERTLAR